MIDIRIARQRRETAGCRHIRVWGECGKGKFQPFASMGFPAHRRQLSLDYDFQGIEIKFTFKLYRDRVEFVL